MIPAEWRVWCGTGTYMRTSDSLRYEHTQTKQHPAILAAYIERVNCNATRMDSNNFPYATKSCACAPVEVLAESISWSVDNSSAQLPEVKMLWNPKIRQYHYKCQPFDLLHGLD